MNQIKGFAQGFFAGRWYQPLICEYDDDGKVIQITETHPTNPRIDPRTFIQSIPNGHSHCFQFAMVGLTEFIDTHGDDFWAWRHSMYHIALSITPDDLRVIARALYTTMKLNGYRSVTEFHYVHHDQNGQRYQSKTLLADILIEVALEVGLNIVLVPVYYKNGGFDQVARITQKRFTFEDTDEYLNLVSQLDHKWGRHPHVKIGKGVHSLRATSQNDLITICNTLEDDRPFHIHIAEQQKEVQECLNAWGSRPVQWLLDHVAVHKNYHLVHATHLNAQEIAGIAQASAYVNLCPTTEGNLGDGIFPLVDFISNHGKFWIGSDSHVIISPFEELRLLDYSQRLTYLSRGTINVNDQGQRGEILWQHITDVDEYADDRGPFFSGFTLSPSNLITSMKKQCYQMSALVYGAQPETIDSIITNGIESVREMEPEIMLDFAQLVSYLG